MEQSKICKKCEINKPLDDFYNHPKSKDGKRYLCKKCWREQCAEWENNNPIRKKEINTNWRKNNPDKVKEYTEKSKQHHRTTMIGSSKKVFKNVNKRAYPENATCELCQTQNRRVSYHHWDDEHPELGMWVCWECHILVELVEKHNKEYVISLIEKYLLFKQKL